MTRTVEANIPSKVIRNDDFISLLTNEAATWLLVSAGFMHSMMRLDDAVADVRSHVEAHRAGEDKKAESVVVGVVQPERDVGASDSGQVLPSPLQIDGPGTACKKRRRE